MFNGRSKSAISAIILIVGSVMCICGQSTSAVTELDPAFAIGLEVNRGVRFDFYSGREKSEEIHAGRTKAGLGVSFRTRPLFKRFLEALDTDKQARLVMAVIYEYSIASEPDASTTEHRVIVDGTIRYVFPRDVMLSDRNRVEFRWLNGDNHVRYQNRPMLERPFRFLRRDITPYISGTASWDQRYREWNIFKFSSGVIVPLWRRLSVDVLYERQHCTTCADPHTNIFGLTLNLNLRLKRK